MENNSQRARFRQKGALLEDFSRGPLAMGQSATGSHISENARTNVSGQIYCDHICLDESLSTFEPSIPCDMAEWLLG